MALRLSGPQSVGSAVGPVAPPATTLGVATPSVVPASPLANTAAYGGAWPLSAQRPVRRFQMAVVRPHRAIRGAVFGYRSAYQRVVFDPVFPDEASMQTMLAAAPAI